MMFYYIDKIEQVDAPEGFPWTVNEYGSRTQYKETLPQVQSRYYKVLSDISNALKDIDPSKPYYYACVKIVNSDGEVVEEKELGKRVEPQPVEQPETEG